MASFCLLHGAWHDGSCWDAVAGALVARGHHVVAPDLPFHDPRTTVEDRVRPAREALEGAADPVVVVGHSLAAGYAPLVAAERPGALLVHVCPALGPLRTGFPFPARAPDGTRAWDVAAAVDVMYPRLAPATARALTRRLRPMAAPADGSPVGDHPDVPTAFVYATDDEFFAPASQRSIARGTLGIEPIEIPGGHFPMVEDSDALAHLLDRLALEHAA